MAVALHEFGHYYDIVTLQKAALDTLAFTLAAFSFDEEQSEREAEAPKEEKHEEDAKIDYPPEPAQFNDESTKDEAHESSEKPDGVPKEDQKTGTKGDKLKNLAQAIERAYHPENGGRPVQEYFVNWVTASDYKALQAKGFSKVLDDVPLFASHILQN
jgi:hypothetical protein